MTTSLRAATRLLAAAAIGASLAVPGSLPAQHTPRGAPSMLESHQRAKALIDSAVAAHGGVEALRAARRIRVTIEGHEYHRLQSRRVDPPYDRIVRKNDLMIDLDRGRIVNEQTRGYAGGFYYTNRFVSDSATHFLIEPRNQLYTSQQYPPAAQQLGNLFMVPHFYLLTALENAAPAQRRWLGPMRLVSGGIVDAVATPLSNGGGLVLGFDPATHRLRAILSLAPDPLLGDTEVNTEFLDYRMIGGVLMPSRVVLRRAGEVYSDVRFTSATLDYAIPDSLLRPPANFTAVTPGPPPDPLRELASGVWGIRAGNAWSLVVAFDDHVLVVDAPPTGAPGVIERVATLAPGKPIRYVVPTHHHDDHFTGVRHYAAAGAITVTTPGNLDFFRRVMTAPRSTLLGNVPQVAGSPDARVEAITGKRRVFTDGRRTVEIHDIGPNTHADEMLVAWIPEEGILFQADLVLTPPDGAARRGANADATMGLAEYIRRQGWKVRVFGGSHAFLENPGVFEEIARAPVLPP